MKLVAFNTRFQNRKKTFDRATLSERSIMGWIYGVMRTNVTVLKGNDDLFDAVKKASSQRRRYVTVVFVRNSRPPGWVYQVS